MGFISYDSDGNRVEWHLPTQDAVARRFAMAEAGRVRFCHDAQAWFLWDGAAWRRDRTGAVLHRIRALARDLAADPFGKPGATAGNMRFVAGVERFARGDPALAVTAEAFVADPMMLGTPAGPIDLRTGARVQASPSQGISLTTAVAAADAADCSMWRRFLHETFAGDDDLIGFVQRFLGYALTGSVAEQVILFGWGPGGNGKSVFLATVLAVMGEQARTASLVALTSVDAERYGRDLAGLMGARLVAVPESDAGPLWAERRLKLLTGGDRGPDGTRCCKILVMGNHPPGLQHVDEAIQRRFRIVPFGQRPARPDRGLETALRAEAPAILRWMIEGCLAWQAEGLGQPPAVVEATADYLETQDAFGQFLAERCDLAQPAGRITVAALFAAWRLWAEAQGEPVGSRRTLAEAMNARGFRRDRSETERFYVGLGLRLLTADTS